MLSHQLKQFTIDGDKTIIQNPSDAQKKEHEKFVMEMHEVGIIHRKYIKYILYYFIHYFL
jgi:predicted HAD superfamily phosphohydrolase YqeG